MINDNACRCVKMRGRSCIKKDARASSLTRVNLDACARAAQEVVSLCLLGWGNLAYLASRFLGEHPCRSYWRKGRGLRRNSSPVAVFRWCSRGGIRTRALSSTRVNL